MLIDEVHVNFKGGDGGPGKMSFFPGMKSGPDGGNGGRGGDLYVEAVSDLTILNQFSKTKSLAAENGQSGDSNRKSGKDGGDLVIKLPIGSELTDKDTSEVIVLSKPGEKIRLCKGGLGGRGNSELKSSVNTTPEYAQPGLPGEKRQFHINLKLIADYGLIGLPNAGKSSLLNELTAANVKVGSYPFTTLEPNLGTLNGKIIADIPGLIEGASSGKGLGIRFLKHIEKVGLLLHCISAESENPVEDFKVIMGELEKFSPKLALKEQIILLTKADLVNKKGLDSKIKLIKKLKKEVIPVSVHDWDSLQILLEKLK